MKDVFFKSEVQHFDLKIWQNLKINEELECYDNYTIIWLDNQQYKQ